MMTQREAAEVAAVRLEACAEGVKQALTPLAEAIALAPAELLQELPDANLNLHHALGRLNSARAMLERLRA